MKSNWFRVAVEGATTDGRVIQRNWIDEMVETYNTAKYGARIFIEHIRGLNPEWGFRAQGDVLGLRKEEVEIDGEKRLALYAQIQPTAEMVGLIRSGQKIYSSIEVNPDFANSGQAYLMGIGITDSPASLGTEVLSFAAQNPAANPYASRKQNPGNVFSAAAEAAIELEDESAPEAPGLLDRVREIFSAGQADLKRQVGDAHRAIEEIAGVVAGLQLHSAAPAAPGEALQVEVGEIDLTQIAGFTKLREDVDALLNHFALTPAGGSERPAATGALAGELTDC